MMEQAEQMGTPLDVLITPVGGGGLLSGCATAAKGTRPTIRVVGAEPLGWLLASAVDLHSVVPLTVHYYPRC